MGEIEIREVSLDDADALRAAYPALRAGDMHGRPGRPFWSEREFLAMLRAELPDIRRRLFAAYDGDRVVGGVFLMVPLLDNLDKLYLHVIVHPDQRARGVGSALERRASEVARELGRPTMIGESYVPTDQRGDHPYRRFAESHGYALANIEIARSLELPVAADQLDAWEAEAAPHLDGYRLATFDGPIPDDLAPSFCHLLGLLASDAPTGDLDFEPEVVPIEALRAREKVIDEQGRTVFTTLAIAGNGDAVADTVLAVSPDDPENVMQWATLVRSDHRGHRLGLAVKARNLRAMQTAFPDRKRVWTQNSETNSHMVSINEKLGFTPVEVLLEFQRKSAASDLKSAAG